MTRKHLFSLPSRIGAALAAMALSILTGPRPLKRAFTCDVAFGYRMGAGFPGDVNRTHPFSVLAELLDTTDAVQFYGSPVLVNTAGTAVRGIKAADGSTTPLAIRGIAVRPFPTQQTSGGMTSTIGVGSPPASGILDVCRQGFIMSKLPAGASVKKGDQVFFWAAATSGSNIQGLPVAAASSTNTISVTNACFNGPADANGNVEIEIWPLR